MNSQQNQRQHQRFSWQSPPPDDAPPYEPPQQPLPSLETHASNPRDTVFSYAQTPIEHRQPTYASSQSQPPLPPPPVSPIGQAAESFYSAHMAVNQPQIHPSYASRSGVTAQETVPSTPARHEAPFSPDSFPVQPTQNMPTTNHARKLSNLAPLNTSVAHHSTANMPPIPQTPAGHRSEASPLPQKTPVSPHSHTASISPISSGPITISTAPIGARESVLAEPYSPHGMPMSPSHAVFSPHAAHGPNGLDAALHQPGQIAHPNMNLANNGTPHDWKHGLCSFNTSDCSTCFTGLFCPCILYGKTSYRLGQKSDKKDPTDMLGYSAANGHCGLMSVSCGLWWLFPMIQRTRIRHLYKLGGSLADDIVKGCCCCCCVTVQNEREVREREETTRRWAGPASTDVYKRTGGMEYKPQH